MFSWICPKCGKEVPPSYNECPNCAANIKADTADAVPPRVETVSAPPPAPVATPEPPSRRAEADPPFRAPAHAHAGPEYPPVARNQKQLSPALVALGSGLGVGALLAVLYIWVLPPRAATSAQPAATAAFERVPPAGGASQHPLAKHIEVSGVRVLPGPSQTARVQYLVTNHSAADLPELRLELILRAPKGEAVFEFPATVPSIGPYEFKEMTSTVKTAMKPYEFPDWAMLRADFRILNEP